MSYIVFDGWFFERINVRDWQERRDNQSLQFIWYPIPYDNSSFIFTNLNYYLYWVPFQPPQLSSNSRSSWFH